jgi:hypothetical protein
MPYEYIYKTSRVTCVTFALSLSRLKGRGIPSLGEIFKAWSWVSIFEGPSKLRSIREEDLWECLVHVVDSRHRVGHVL